MKIKPNYTEEREVDIEIPFFRKDDSICLKLLAVIDEKTVVTIFEGGGRTVVSADTVSSYQRDIVAAFTSWQEITEEEFLKAHAAALKSLSLIPELVNDIPSTLFTSKSEVDEEIDREREKAQLSEGYENFPL